MQSGKKKKKPLMYKRTCLMAAFSIRKKWRPESNRITHSRAGK
jgi:hypothetical protein